MIQNYILYKLKVLQQRERPGDRRFKEYQVRINPYNPLSYVALTALAIATFFMFGLHGVMKDFRRNPFEWS